MSTTNHTKHTDRTTAIWFQEDAAQLHKSVELYLKFRDSMHDWLAVKVQDNAAHSAGMARKFMGLPE